jgi:UDP:flavonoid glycosyltransferase YjiC (YdhE family)
MLNILIATYPMAGHVGPLRPIARELVRRGHHVRWYTGSRFEATVQNTGAEFKAMSPELDQDDRPLDEVYPERARLRGLAGLKWDLKNVFVGPAAGHAKELQKLMNDLPADLLLADNGMTGARYVSELMGLRLVTVGVTPLTLPGPNLAPFGPGLQPATNGLGRARNAVLRQALARFVFREVEAYANEVRAGIGLPASETDIITGSVSRDLHLQVGVPGLEHPRPNLPRQVRFLGALTDRSPGGAAIPKPQWWPDLITNRRPVVHVTQGTVANSDLEDLVFPTMRALADEDVLVVAITGSKDVRYDSSKLPANARIAPLLPYDELLPLTSVLVTNGGYGTVNQALSNGIPVVVSGTTEDKPEVGARVSRSGTGIDLRSAKPSQAKIRQAVRRVIDERAFREQAQKLAVDYQAIDAGPVAADLMEELAAADTSSLPK